MAGAVSEIQQEDIISRLKLSGAWFEAIAELEEDALLSQLAQAEGLSVSDAELQEAFDAYRLDLELQKADDTNAWLAASGITVEEVETALESGILGEKLAEKLIDDAKIDTYYNENPSEFEYAQISQLAVADAGAAEELALSIREEGEDFSALAKQHSADAPTKLGGGYLGRVSRDEAGGLPGDVCDRVFASSAGEVIGPFELPGGVHLIICVHEVGRVELDDDLRAALRAQLFGAHLAQLAEG